ncbi:TauD/TfdA family dioxygenase [Pseudomonas sp. Sample_24]|jgi:alpha-ketoglutarate-dependent taurine dioxygenase|uniref:TauD/TfdA family dioxygenase n=1 Tax=Pseudomonas sp. Sample_24 TaxID=2448268 RepID=UPI001032E30D|nr:TauD/TfdA family dioxygenase [Pseudomonas sp. Sample_24]
MTQSIYPARVIGDGEQALINDTQGLFEELSNTGVIILRNCIRSVDEFGAFVKKHSSRLSLDPGREITQSGAQLVDAGTDAVGLHCENGNAPIWPDLTWFFCEIAPTKGSQTTLCDGVSVYRDLSEQTRRHFENKRIRYRRTVPGEKWRKFVCHHNPQIQQMDDARFEHLSEIIGEQSNTRMAYNPDTDCVTYAFCVRAYQTSSFCNFPAFANSMLGPSFNYEKPVIDFENDEEISPDLWAEITHVTERHTHIVGWNDLDLVMIDNRRVMHGRNPIIDAQRRIYNALSYR